MECHLTQPWMQERQSPLCRLSLRERISCSRDTGSIAPSLRLLFSSMYGDMSRIEAAKRALWSLYLLNRKFFPSDSVYIVGFGALASKVASNDIRYLKTFEPGSDFLHYTNYQAAFRLASKILQKNGALNK